MSHVGCHARECCLVDAMNAHAHVTRTRVSLLATSASWYVKSQTQSVVMGVVRPATMGNARK